MGRTYLPSRGETHPCLLSERKRSKNPVTGHSTLRQVLARLPLRATDPAHGRNSYRGVGGSEHRTLAYGGRPYGASGGPEAPAQLLTGATARADWKPDP